MPALTSDEEVSGDFSKHLPMPLLPFIAEYGPYGKVHNTVVTTCGLLDLLVK
jgi:hypothetical protein